MKFSDENSDSDDEDDVYLLHNLAEQGHVDRLHSLLPLSSAASIPTPRLSVLSSETSLLEKDDMGFLPLHVAVIHQQVDFALHLLRYSPALTSAMLRLKGGDFGTPILHLVLRVGAINSSCSEKLMNELFPRDKQEENSEFYGDDMRILLFEKIAEIDDEGSTVFHLCARYDLVACMDMLTSFYERQFSVLAEEKHNVSDLKTLLEKGNRVGFRPLHEAMKYQAAGVAKMLVSKYNVDLNLVTSLHQTPVHVAALVNFTEGFEILRHSPRSIASTLTYKDIYGFTAAQVAHNCEYYALEKCLLEAERGKEYVVEVASQETFGAQTVHTQFFFHPEAWKHLPMAYHRRGGPDLPPENPERINTLVDPVFGILRSREFKRKDVKWEEDIERADIADILRVHEYNYVDLLRQNCASLATFVGNEKHNTSKFGLSNHILPDEANSAVSCSLDDAGKRPTTFMLDSDTALSACSYDAAIRAAGAVCKAVDEVIAGKCRNAFCIVRPPGHHAGPVGKVVCENDPEGSLGFCLFNNVAVGAAYARAHFKNRGINKVAILDFDVHHGNGTEEIVRQLVPSVKELSYMTPYGTGKQIVHQYKPWRTENDSSNVFFCSVHGYGHKDPENKEILDEGETRGWFFPGSGGSSVKENPMIWDEGLPFCREGSPASRLKWRCAFRDRVLPKLCKFQPDLIFLSAGFDAHKKELVNWGYGSLLEQDYEWLVDHVKQVANTCCEGRLISVLEGGYNFHGRMVSPFARSVAAHTRALINPSRERWNEDKISKESAYEQALLAKYLMPAGASVTGLTMLQKKKRDKSKTTMMRGKRLRKEVDYVALAKELALQQSEQELTN
ncbi:histone deacetylase [Plasmopara halstedii]|uniref:Histone deacetylase n=1 Tax=Plasmopara halstedii TaxID=4781 RepID=A0A0P1AUC4_PLAHL|nr:histone deacetylase [Plasmopara halstedii]CEG45202.1 histone deacetylase [Plasmopara halstedii]|eukprot:XP_024581571.1 histone deacetylase [Plasmopara halstedii]